MNRDITLNDIDRIYELGLLYDPNFKNKYDLSAYIENNIYIIKCYEEDSIIKGFIIATNISDNIEIYLVYVDEDYRQKGIATNLINSLNGDSILLEVSKDNIPAYNLYKKLGFVEINVRKGYYNGTDAIVMKKVIE